MRIGECIGLRWDDVDFEKRIISVDHTLVYRPDENGKLKVIQSIMGHADIITTMDVYAEATYF